MEPAFVSVSSVGKATGSGSDTSFREAPSEWKSAHPRNQINTATELEQQECTVQADKCRGVNLRHSRIEAHCLERSNNSFEFCRGVYIV